MIDAVPIALGGAVLLLAGLVPLLVRARLARRPRPPLDVNDAQAFIAAAHPLVKERYLSSVCCSVTVWGDGEVQVHIELDGSRLSGRGDSLPAAVKDLVKHHPRLTETLSAWL